jgi:hypothetical protein
MKGLTAEQVAELLAYINKVTPSSAMLAESKDDCITEHHFQLGLHLMTVMIGNKIKQLSGE